MKMVIFKFKNPIKTNKYIENKEYGVLTDTSFAP